MGAGAARLPQGLVLAGPLLYINDFPRHLKLCADDIAILVQNDISKYYICNCTIQQVDSAKYLGVTITNNFSWSEHITKIINKANSTRAFLQRNLSQCQRCVSQPVITLVLDLYLNMPQPFGHHIYYVT